MRTCKRTFLTTLLVACSSAPVGLAAHDDPPAGAGEAPLKVIVGATDEDAQEPTRSEEEVVRAREPSESEDRQPSAWLGLSLKTVDGDLATHLGTTEGVLVQAVLPGSPAAAAKLHAGDIIIRFNGEKISGPQALKEALVRFAKERSERSEAAKDDKKSTDSDESARVKLTVLRHGQELVLTARPGNPPADAAPRLQIAETEANQEEMSDILKDLQAQGSAKVLRFGPPVSVDGRQLFAPQRHDVRVYALLFKDKDGTTTEVRIERVDGAPATITVKEGDSTRQITEAEIDQLPEKLRQRVGDALQAAASAGAAHQQAVADEKHALREKIMEEVRENMRKNAQLHDQLRHLEHGSRLRVVGPEEADDLSRAAEELAGKFRDLAEEAARRGAKTVQDFAAMPEQIKQLRAQVDELKAEIAELKAQLKKHSQP